MKPGCWKTLLPCLLLLLLGACAFGRHIDRGDEALARGDFQRALTEYQAALAIEPDSREAAEKFQAAKEAAAGASAAEAKRRMGEGDLRGAIEAAATALSLVPDSETAKATVREVSDRSQAGAEALAAKGAFAESLSLYEAVSARLPSERAGAEAKAVGVRSGWAASLNERATTAESAGRKAEALLLFAKSAQLAGGASAARRDALRQELEARPYMVQIVEGKNEETAAAVAQLRAAPLPPRIKLASAGEKVAAPSALLHTELSGPSFDSSRSNRRESASYQSGVRSVENPFYRSRLDRVTDEERRLVDCENDVTRLESDLARYQGDVAREGPTPNVSTGAEQNMWNAESQLESARRRVVDQRYQLQQAREELRREPPTREEPVYSELVFTVTMHTLRAAALLRASVEHPDRRPARENGGTLEALASDEEHAEQPIAGVPADPLRLPPRETLIEELRRQAGERLVALVLDSFAGYRQQMLERAQAASGPERLDGLVRYLLADLGNVPGEVVAEVVRLSGVPDPVEVLTR